MTAPIALPYTAPRIGVEVAVDQLVPVRVVRVPRWLLAGLARIECARHGHHPARRTLAQDNRHHCLNCGRTLDRAAA